MGAVTAAVVGGTVAAGAIGSSMAADAQRDAAKSAEQTARGAQRMVMGVELPEIEKQRIALEELAVQGELEPEMLQALELAPSSMEEISTDPRLAAAQMKALETLGEISEGGMTEGDMAALETARRQVDADQTAREQAILQDMQQRGISGSGMELAMKLQAAQGSADRQGAASLDQVQAAQQRALQALSQEAQLAGAIRGQEFGEDAQIAAAQDAIRQFNLQNQQRVQDTNVNLRNQAQGANLAARQAAADANVALRNQQQMYNKELEQQRYQNELNRASAAAGLAQGVAQAQRDMGAANANQISGITSAITSGIGLAGSMANKPAAKT